MTKRITVTTFTYVEDHILPIRVEMSSVEGSPVCTIRFGSSFTLNSVTPGDLMDLAYELEVFARRAQDFHYPEETDDDDDDDDSDDGCGGAGGDDVSLADEFYSALMDENMERDEAQQHIAGDGFDAFYTAHAAAARAATSKTPTPDPRSKVDRLMKGTVSAPQTDPMNDPMNW